MSKAEKFLNGTKTTKISEAENIAITDLPDDLKKSVESFLKDPLVGKHYDLFHGIHGNILAVDTKLDPRMDKQESSKLAKLLQKSHSIKTFRWVELRTGDITDPLEISIGF